MHTKYNRENDMDINKSKYNNVYYLKRPPKSSKIAEKLHQLFSFKVNDWKYKQTLILHFEFEQLPIFSKF